MNQSIPEVEKAAQEVIKLANDYEYPLQLVSSILTTLYEAGMMDKQEESLTKAIERIEGEKFLPRLFSNKKGQLNDLTTKTEQTHNQALTRVQEILQAMIKESHPKAQILVSNKSMETQNKCCDQCRGTTVTHNYDDSRTCKDFCNNTSCTCHNRYVATMLQ